MELVLSSSMMNPEVGLLVKTLIEWETLGLSCIAVLSNAEEAISVILDNGPSIVITDIRMPKVSGLDLIGRVKDVVRDTKFIVISATRTLSTRGEPFSSASRTTS